MGDVQNITKIAIDNKLKFSWLDDKSYDEPYLIIDDKIKDIVAYFSDDYIINCVDDKGITENLTIKATKKYLLQK